MALKKSFKADLKRKYNRYIETSMIIALAFLIIAFKTSPESFGSNIKMEAPQELIDVEDVEITKQESAPPPPPRPVIPIEAPQENILDDIEISGTDLIIDEELNAPPPPIEEKEEEIVPDFFFSVEEMPSPVGGIAAIFEKIEYPKMAKIAGIQGKVSVLAYVDEDGTVTKVELIKGIGGGCDEEALNAVSLTKFNPGKQRGKPVRVKIAIPILFKLN